ncbi:hypothetical protein BDN70DRAFT_939128 [Pholiota conissans]|uniref:Uncharacterized protein n=1 Tax=Pholiota conissans TaxID=109636 RepID=A0A9P5YJW6_9AGAR|nr:hypothetical protein BDN70DRAFT_939128 [Pholiota conissans]
MHCPVNAEHLYICLLLPFILHILSVPPTSRFKKMVLITEQSTTPIEGPPAESSADVRSGDRRTESNSNQAQSLLVALHNLIVPLVQIVVPSANINGM